MGWLIGAVILPPCVCAAWYVLHRPLRIFFEDLHVDQARDSFRRRREHLEAEFVTSLGRFDRDEGLRWEGASWHDEIVWARDRQTRRLLALVAVHFEPELFEPPQFLRHATAVFECDKGRWKAEGRRLDQTRPSEAVGRNRRFEPVAIGHPNPRHVG
mgnify:CR=1 FL=1